MLGSFTRHLMETSDGAQVALYEYARPEGVRPASDTPALLCHGLGANRLCFDFPFGRSLARHLAGRGIATWVIEFRGVNRSTLSQMRRWKLADYHERDLPEAIDFILSRSRSAQADLVGHSYGGTLIYRYLAQGAGQVRRAVSLNAPVLTDRHRTAVLDFFMGLGRAVTSVSPMVPQKALGRLACLTPFSHRFVAPSFANPDNLGKEGFRFMFTQATSNVPAQVSKDLMRWYADPGAFAIEFERIRHEILVFSSELDQAATPASVREAFGRIASPRKEHVHLARSNGFGADYGHVDTLTGARSPDEIYPRIESFLMSGVRG